MIEVSHLTKRFGKSVAVDNISFSVATGEIVGFLGPNGAGKTTTMRILACYLPATGGSVTIGGMDVYTHSVQVRQKLGYLPENVPLYDEMRVHEYLNYRGRLKGMHGRRLRRRMDECISSCGLDSVRNKIMRHLSKGFRQRVGLADSLLHEPELLILDEPTVGLDPIQIREIRTLVRSLAKRHTVILSSHILPEVEMICDRVLIIHQGKIVASDTTANLLGLMKGNPRINIEIQGPLERIQEQLENMAGIVRVAVLESGSWNKLVCECDPGSDLCPQLFSLVSKEQWSLRELKMEKPNLEDVFVEMTRAS